MCVRDEHLGQRCAGECLLELVEVLRLAYAGVDESRHAARNEPRPVAGPGHLAGVVRMKRYRMHCSG